MAQFYSELSPAHQEFIQNQKIFFVATAAPEGRINLSPKGLDSLRILDPNRLIWLNYTGSGNETAAHLLAQNRMTIMFCSFEGKPLILRLYGKCKTFHERDPEFGEHLVRFRETDGARQIFDFEIESCQTSCGYAVPIMEFKEERSLLRSWNAKYDKDSLKAYQKKKNSKSIDGLPTGLE